jgi:adenine-specific DNA-methyltransferase
MVKAYRDTWELGLHSYLTYLRDRLLLARELLTESGSVFVQIGDENVHHVREVMDEVFGPDNLCGLIPFRKTGGLRSKLLDSIVDYLLWYARDVDHVKYRQLFEEKRPGEPGATQYRYVVREGKLVEVDPSTTDASEICTHGDLTSQGNPVSDYVFHGETFRGGWKTTNPEGLGRLVNANRIAAIGKTLRYVRYLRDFSYFPIVELWDDTGVSGFASQKLYVVQTNTSVVERCALMTTDPGDIVLDPTCGSGTTAYVAEQWGRRWITIDTSRVPLALTRQRLLTATFPYYELQDPERGPGGGFTYKRKQNARGEEVGGIVPHVTLKSIANDEPPAEEVLVDRPEVESKITRVTGPFVVEATIPTPVEDDVDEAAGDGGPPEDGSYLDRMLEALRRNPSLQLGGNRTISLRNVRPPAKALMLSAEAALEPDDAPIAILFGPENGAINESTVYHAVREAHLRSYEQLLVIGFAIEPGAREFVERAELQVGIPATYVQATPDLVMGDLLKTMRSSQIFSVAGLPDVAIRTLPPEEDGGEGRYEVELLGLDVFDPVEMDVEHRDGSDVPAWLLDTDYNGMVFHVSQAFFPRTGA